MSRARGRLALAAGVLVCAGLAHVTLSRATEPARGGAGCPMPVLVDDRLACTGEALAAAGAVCPDATLSAGDTLATPSCAVGRMDAQDLQNLHVVLDVNVASAAELTSLPGIGPALADRIVAARPFVDAADLARVRGIGPAKLARIRSRVRVTAQRDAR